MALEGISHTSYMNSSINTDYVRKNDLKPNVEESLGHQMISEVILEFLG